MRCVFICVLEVICWFCLFFVTCQQWSSLSPVRCQPSQSHLPAVIFARLIVPAASERSRPHHEQREMLWFQRLLYTCPRALGVLVLFWELDKEDARPSEPLPVRLLWFKLRCRFCDEECYFCWRAADHSESSLTDWAVDSALLWGSKKGVLLSVLPFLRMAGFNIKGADEYSWEQNVKCRSTLQTQSWETTFALEPVFLALRE